MRTLSIFIALTLFVGVSTVSLAQKKEKDKGKQEKKEEKKKIKELKKEMKKLDPLVFRDRYQEWSALKQEVPALKKQADMATSEIEAYKKKTVAKDDEIARAKTECEEKKKKAEEAQTEKLKSNPQQDFSRGYVLKVQIGQVGNGLALDAPVEDTETDSDGKLKYTLGYFRISNPSDKTEYDRVYKDADKLKSYLRAMGVKSAVIVVYKDNNPVPLSQLIDEHGPVLPSGH